MNEADKIVSIKFWGSRDRDRAARAEQQAAELSSLGLLGERDKPPDHVMAWQLYGPTKADEERRRRLNLKRLEEKHGLRPRSWV
jgi:hypothetical protein